MTVLHAPEHKLVLVEADESFGWLPFDESTHGEWRPVLLLEIQFLR